MAEWIIEIKDGKFPIGKWTELVRCKDCRWFNAALGSCPEVDSPLINHLTPDDFCSRGERREDG